MKTKSGQSRVVLWIGTGLTACWLLAGHLSALEAAGPARKQAADAMFETRVKPILTANCLRCHAGRKVKGKLDLSTRDNVLLGGRSGPAVVPGKPNDSLLLEVVVPGGKPHMPPKKQLGRAEITTLVKWIGGLKAGDLPANAKRKTDAKKKRKRGEDDDDD